MPVPLLSISRGKNVAEKKEMNRPIEVADSLDDFCNEGRHSNQFLEALCYAPLSR
jgi:hypothetical protein